MIDPPKVSAERSLPAICFKSKAPADAGKGLHGT
jgi:hypothetical protein